MMLIVAAIRHAETSEHGDRDAINNRVAEGDQSGGLLAKLWRYAGSENDSKSGCASTDAVVSGDGEREFR
jgi:hypothetical protein